MSIEKFISPFIESQFPQFYQEEGPLFIAFVKAYYEWLEKSENVLGQTRSLMELRDLDTTLDSYLKYFKNAYINSLPENIVADKRLLIKHILELYRSKGTDKSYEFLFRLLFNEDIEIYYPGKYIFKLSDNEWVLPKYIEVSDSPMLTDLIGQRIYSSSTLSTAIVENYFTKSINNKLVNVLTLSNITGRFKYGEKILSESVPEITAENAPIIFGSLSSVSVYEGGINYNVGDLLDIRGKGKGGIARVISTRSKNGEVTFELIDGGTGFSLDAIVNVDGRAVNITNISNTSPVRVTTNQDHLLANGNSVRIDYVDGMEEINTGTYSYYTGIVNSTSFDIYTNSILTTPLNGTSFGTYFANSGYVYMNTGGDGATFEIGSIVNKEIFDINIDDISDYEATIIDSTVSGYVISVNSISGNFNLNDNIYMANVNVKELDVTLQTATILLQGESLSNSSLGISNIICTISDGSYIQIKGSGINNANLVSGINLVSNTSSSVLRINSAFVTQSVNATAKVTASNSTTVTANTQTGFFVFGEKLFDSTSGANANIGVVSRVTNWGFPKVSLPDVDNMNTLIGNALTNIQKEVGTIASLTNINSGEGYSSDPVVTIVEPTIYKLKIQDDRGEYKGFDAEVTATAGFANGIVTALEIVDSGFGYERDETLNLNNANNQYSVVGSSVVDLNGISRGYWKDNRSFTSDNIYLQDSFYYQNYSYEILATRMLSTYESFVKDLIHPAGLKLFGRYAINNVIDNRSSELVYSSFVSA
jgi:hypothetical protein